MLCKIATPISDIFGRSSSQTEEIIKNSDALEIRDISKPVKSKLPRIYHSEFDLTRNWSEKDINYLVSLVRENNVKMATFHLGSCYSKPVIKQGIFQPGGKKLSPDEIFNNASGNIERFRLKLNRRIKIGVENNNYFPSGAYGIITEPLFINRLLSKINLYLLLDIAHARITAFNKGVSPDDYIKQFNLAKVCQMHLSRPQEFNGCCRDAHEELNKKDWGYFKRIAGLCPKIEFVTIEYYKEEKNLILMLKQLKRILK